MNELFDAVFHDVEFIGKVSKIIVEGSGQNERNIDIRTFITNIDGQILIQSPGVKIGDDLIFHYELFNTNIRFSSSERNPIKAYRTWKGSMLLEDR